jgi:adenine-specific DNA-methyltransferase
MPTLHWIGKEKIINHHLDVPYRVLEHKYGFTEKGKQIKPTGNGNMIIHGDNLEALKSLLPKYEGKIKCIYIDPPYNTGNEGWVYNDNVNDPKIKKWLGQVVGKESEDLTRHDKWLCMMYPRLKLLYKLLSNDGAMFISIDDNEQCQLKLMMDEVFGSRNFIANISVVNNLKGRSDDKFIATAHEHLLIYQKGKFISKGVPIPEQYQNEYKEADQKGSYRLQGLRKRGNNAREIDRPNLFYPIFFDPKTKKLSLTEEPHTIKILPKLSNGENGTWRWGKETLLQRLDEVEIKLVKTRNEYDVFQKDYLSIKGENKTIKPKSIWIGAEFSSEAGTLQLKNIFKNKIFETPKSINFIEYCLLQVIDKNSIILDSFAGSGTTAHAVLNLNKQDDGNRKFILIEMEDYAETITAERVKRVIKGYSDKEGTGGSFDYYSLGKPLFDEENNLNEEVDVEKIREYIWFTETRTEYKSSGSSFLGIHNDTGYYFIYDNEQITTLDYKTLAKQVKTKAERYIIYADNCLLPESFMTLNNIEFKKIPRDITHF